MDQTEKKVEVNCSHPFSLYQMMWKKGFDFESKSSLAEFGWAMLVHFVVFILLIVLSHIEMTIKITDSGIIGAVLFTVYFVTSYVPAIALMKRRLKDIGRSGATIWLLCLPFAGWIALGVLLFSNGIDTSCQ